MSSDCYMSDCLKHTSRPKKFWLSWNSHNMCSWWKYYNTWQIFRASKDQNCCRHLNAQLLHPTATCLMLWFQLLEDQSFTVAITDNHMMSTKELSPGHISAHAVDSNLTCNPVSSYLTSHCFTLTVLSESMECFTESERVAYDQMKSMPNEADGKWSCEHVTVAGREHKYQHCWQPHNLPCSNHTRLHTSGVIGLMHCDIRR